MSNKAKYTLAALLCGVILSASGCSFNPVTNVPEVLYGPPRTPYPIPTDAPMREPTPVPTYPGPIPTRFNPEENRNVAVYGPPPSSNSYTRSTEPYSDNK